MDSLMKKGLRHEQRVLRARVAGLDGFPDEEGIKTDVEFGVRKQDEALMDSLMKKGLRPAWILVCRPDCALMDSLMKKGLRRTLVGDRAGAVGLDGFPDEEGIKTVRLALPFCRPSGLDGFPDEEGIKTHGRRQ